MKAKRSRTVGLRYSKLQSCRMRHRRSILRAWNNSTSFVVGANGHAEVLRVVNTGSATSESSSSAASQTADVEGKGT